jgi:hypothetical protein
MTRFALDRARFDCLLALGGCRVSACCTRQNP